MSRHDDLIERVWASGQSERDATVIVAQSAARWLGGQPHAGAGAGDQGDPSLAKGVLKGHPSPLSASYRRTRE